MPVRRAISFVPRSPGPSASAPRTAIARSTEAIRRSVDLVLDGHVTVLALMETALPRGQHLILSGCRTVVKHQVWARSRCPGERRNPRDYVLDVHPPARTGGPARRRPRDLRRGLPVRARTPRLSAGGRLRPGGRARTSRAGASRCTRSSCTQDPTSSRRSPTTPTARSSASSVRTTCSSDQPAGAADRPERRRRHRHAAGGQRVQHQRLRPGGRRHDGRVRAMFTEQVGWAAEAGVD